MADEIERGRGRLTPFVNVRYLGSVCIPPSNIGSKQPALGQNCAPISPFFDCLLLNRFRFRSGVGSSRLAWLLFRPCVRCDLSLTLKPSLKLSGYVILPPNVLAGLDMDEDMSPKSSFRYDATMFCERAKSFALSSDSSHSSTEIFPKSVAGADFGSSNV